MSHRLTKTIIDRARYQGESNARYVLWDSLIPGFGLRVYPSGKKAFLLFYRAAGRQRFLTLGAYGSLTLDQSQRQGFC